MALLVDAAIPTTDCLPEWQTSIPISMVLVYSITAGNCIVKRSPPHLEFIWRIMLVALEGLKLLAFLEVTT